MKHILTETARLAGTAMMRYHGKLKQEQIETKKNLKDLVTFVDREVEDLIFERLTTELPGHGFLGEESGDRETEDKARFIVDPIDGTVNYAHGLPHFSVSIAREENGVFTHGLIYVPVLDEMFYAELGQGASVNGQTIQVSQQTEMNKSIIATGFACVRAGLEKDGVPIFSELIYKVRDLRRLGAATVDLAYVAKGIFEGFYEMSLSPWDVAAGSLIVREAGGVVSGFADTDDPIFGKKILASNGYLHDELRKTIEEIYG